MQKEQFIKNEFEKIEAKIPEKVDTSKFEPMELGELIETLGLTIKDDETNKVITFLCMLSAFTENSQFNISFNAPSSSGKSYIPLEVSRLFPSEDVVKLSNCSPQAFFHEQGKYDKGANAIRLDLSRKIIIFLDQQNNQLLEKLRPLLSHDQKELQSKITDKSDKGGNRTKTIIIKGYPSVLFCSTTFKIDEQESTRFILLSPETTQEKIKAGIIERASKEIDAEAYKQTLENNPKRLLLKERIKAIKLEKIDEVNVEEADIIKNVFFGKNKFLKPRYMRDVGRIFSIVKSLALLNLWFREQKGNTITASNDDINQAIKIWEYIAKSQEHSLSPFLIHEILEKVIIPAYKEKNEGELVAGYLGVNNGEIIKKYLQVHGTMLPDWKLKREIIQQLEAAGLITLDKDKDDKRIKLVTPTLI